KQKSQRQHIDNDIEQLNYDLIKATEAYEKFTGQLNVLEERKRNQSETNARFEEELDNLNHELKNAQDEKNEITQQIETLK
ncbi:hypothetical protein Q0M59_19365, partial [Staphylococcus aureus]|nr:hypothetical protein [Staphylococcus aureus]